MPELLDLLLVGICLLSAAGYLGYTFTRKKGGCGSCGSNAENKKIQIKLPPKN